MYERIDKNQENKIRSVANTVYRKKSSGDSTFKYVDNRPEAVAQRKLQNLANHTNIVQSSNDIIQRQLDNEKYETWVKEATALAHSKSLKKDGPNVSTFDEQRINSLFTYWQEHTGTLSAVSDEFINILKANGISIYCKSPYFLKFQEGYAGGRSDLYHE
jgi:hypothetical protein